MSGITSKVSVAAILTFTALTASGCTPVFSLFSF
ncbi:Mycobacterium numidiamassiliense ORFan [Mycobacterium numidiamassiliense]|uniref:Mycobacterium numidiamassiliense ORFan n=1 Tax=Mycobacterium numidiamassiliense TaxID=1841861 RepID=A0A2U3P4S7_9MYCO|nr:Mycobacterium numidiamassiliense ORFan [Mycobacterium numidiamassiliense]